MLVYIVGCSCIHLFQKPNHNECPACGRVALGPSKLRAAAQGIHYASLTCMMFCIRLFQKPNQIHSLRGGGWPFVQPRRELGRREFKTDMHLSTSVGFPFIH